MNPIKALALTQPKTLVPNGMPIGGGVGIDKMEIAGSLAGLKHEAYIAALIVYCYHEDQEKKAAVQLMFHTIQQMKEKPGFKSDTAIKICQSVILHMKSPAYAWNEKSKQVELKRRSNYRIAQDSGLSRSGFTKSHETFYLTAYSIFQSWLDEAFQHIKKQLNDRGIE